MFHVTAAVLTAPRISCPEIVELLVITARNQRQLSSFRPAAEHHRLPYSYMGAFSLTYTLKSVFPCSGCQTFLSSTAIGLSTSQTSFERIVSTPGDELHTNVYNAASISRESKGAARSFSQSTLGKLQASANPRSTEYHQWFNSTSGAAKYPTGPQLSIFTKLKSHLHSTDAWIAFIWTSSVQVQRRQKGLP